MNCRQHTMKTNQFEMRGGPLDGQTQEVLHPEAGATYMFEVAMYAGMPHQEDSSWEPDIPSRKYEYTLCGAGHFHFVGEI